MGKQVVLDRNGGIPKRRRKMDRSVQHPVNKRRRYGIAVQYVLVIGARRFTVVVGESLQARILDRSETPVTRANSIPFVVATRGCRQSGRDSRNSKDCVSH